MAKRPRTVPLFDLVPGKKPADAARPAGNAPIPTLPENAANIEIKPVIREPQGEKLRESSRGALVPTSERGVPMPLVFIGIFIALLVCLGTYVLGTSVGSSKKEKELAGVMRQDPPAIREAGPGLGGSPMGNLEPTEPNAKAKPQPKSNAAGDASPNAANKSTQIGGVTFPNIAPEAFDNPPADKELMIASNDAQGWVSTDTRTRGLNYMTLGVLSRRDGGYAVMLLHANGIPAVAMPVDSGGSSANNRGPLLYRVWLLQGITSEEWRANDSRKGELDKRVREIGKAWKQAKGPTDFADAYWDKLD
jgi:hypothetical protein